MKKIITSGKRKTAIARATIVEGSGEITINRKNYKNLHLFDRLRLEEPLKIFEEVVGKRNFDVEIKTKGGGEKSQIEATRVALSKALIDFAKKKELRDAFLLYDRGLIVADVRRKETYKPGDSKARRKRQKSYR